MKEGTGWAVTETGFLSNGRVTPKNEGGREIQRKSGQEMGMGPGGLEVAPPCPGNYSLPAASGYVIFSGRLTSSLFELAAKETGLLFHMYLIWSDFFSACTFVIDFF